MITHNLVQGSQEWHAYRATHDNASDAPAMMSCSSYKTRDQLIAELATGITPEVDPATQRLYDSGHRFEKLARPLAEEIIGEDLYPCTGSVDGSRLSASFDGLNMLEDPAWEHKRMNERLRAVLSVPGCTGADLPLEYQVQMEQQSAVSQCSKVLFTASAWDSDDQLIEALHCWYTPNLELRARILAGWEQLHKDVATYVPPEAAPAPVVAKQVAHLPVVFDMRVEGKLVACNIEQYKPAALAYIAAISTKLATDQDFSDADADAKFCRDSADKLELAIEQAMGQMGDINQALNTVREIAAAFDAKGLSLEKLVKARKDEIRNEIVRGGAKALIEHITALNVRLVHNYMPHVPADFGGVVKGKRTVESLRNAVNTELARAKIEASAIADRIEANLKTLQASGLVVHDAAALVLKAPDDLAAIIANRVTAEQQRQEAERERILAELAAKLQREAEAKARDDAAQIALQLAAENERNQALALANQAPIATISGADFAPATTALQAREYEQNQAVALTQQAQAAIETVAPPADNVVPMRAAPVPAERTGTPTLKLGQIADRLGFTLTADFLKGLGFEPAATDRASKLYFEADFPLILAALVRHIEGVQSKAAA